jgi:3'-5' exoribonuclease
MASNPQIKDLHSKDEIVSVFLIKNVQLHEAKDGKKYLSLVLSDASGELESRIWQNAESHAENIIKNKAYKVQGKLNLFQGKKQFIIQQIDQLPDDSYDVEEFLMKSTAQPDEMFKKLLLIVEQLDDVYIKELLLSILRDHEIMRRLKTWQAGKTIHHAYRSGLLEHILSCTELAVTLSPHYKVNRNYVVAGCILHDLCKIYELTDGVNVDYTEEGKLVGHLVKGLEIVDKFSYKIPNFPYQLKLHLKHILLSHHGDYEYGSPKIPSTSEAYLVHLIDLMDSKMNSLEMVKRNDQASGHWSQYVKHLDRIVYKSELPYFKQWLPEAREVTPPMRESKTPKKELKQNLGKLLEDWKPED